MPKIEGENPQQRKLSLAGIVSDYLNSKNLNAKLLKNRTNSEGHTDQVVVGSDLGLIHITALSSKNPNEAIPYQGGDQNWLADKEYIAIGWNADAKRTLIFFVKASKFVGRTDLTKPIVKELSEKSLNAILPST